MAERKAGIITILSSPSGAGKTTLVKKISSRNNFKISVSHTTRKPRANEKDGKHYFFVNDKEFKKLIKKRKFLEYAKVFKNYYGSLKETVVEKLQKGENVIFDIDWQGADQIKNKKLDYKLITFFILPPSKEILFERLSNRDMKDKLIADERMKKFSRDVLHWINYDYVVINENLEECYNEIIGYLDNKIKYNKSLIEKHVEKLI